MKYVLFLDILGFKERLKRLPQGEAKNFISRFSSIVYNQWNGNEKCIRNLEGYIVSDSLIINTKDTSSRSLEDLLDVTKAICQDEFSYNSILMRGAIAKGEFDKLEAKELSSLQKGLIVGQAYVDAYLLEGSVKTLGIVLSKEVYEDTQVLNRDGLSILVEIVNKEKSFVLRYLDIDYLLNAQRLEKFVKLASESEWLPHFYNTIYFSMKNENVYKADQVFHNIISLINRNEPSEHWRELDTFIQNAFADGVIADCQTRFLRFIRSKLQ